MPERIAVLFGEEIVNESAGWPIASVDGTVERSRKKSDIEAGGVGLGVITLLWVDAEVESADGLLSGLVVVDLWDSSSGKQNCPDDVAK